jgi:hypothetical protein
MMEEAEFFGLHYYLERGSHSMDAVIRNKCEREVLAVFFEVAKQLDVPIAVETYAHSEGGLKELWKAMGKNNAQIALVISVLSLILSTFPTSDSELTTLEKEAKRLEIEKMRLEIDKLKEDIPVKDERTHQAAEAVAHVLQSNGKIAVRRSNYYRLLLDYPKIDSVGYSPRTKDSRPVPESLVQRSDFGRFILRSDRLPVETDENALIEVFAPVLTEGSYHWRGYYLGNSISFAMLDPQFKALILAKQIHFQHGTRLRCVLNIYKKYDDLGEVTVTGYSVVTVLEHSEGGTNFVETPQGRSYRHANALRESQGDMFRSGEGTA